MSRNPLRRVVRCATCLLASLAAPAAYAGGTPEEAFLVIDPSRTDSMYIANYYIDARNVPSVNALYMNPMAADYFEFAEDNVDALLGTLANVGVRDHSDYIIIPPASGYRIPAAGLISDSCAPVNHLSLAAAYTTAMLSDSILTGTWSSTRRHHYWLGNITPAAFDSELHWYFGAPTDNEADDRYFIGAYLGHTGERGNTVDEIITLIDRAVAVDGTHPAGTFYYMQTTDAARSGPRHAYYSNMVSNIIALGGNAEHLFDVLPTGRHDCLGIMTGWASPDIDGTDMTILPGAFCDHLTSYAGHFDSSSQVKMSRWIAKGAGGSWGAVEEPCNYAGKFPHARMHVFYFQGLSLGESVHRGVKAVPLQGLLYGDPLTRPFAYPPDVQVPDAPTETVSGPVTLTPTATATYPSAAILGLDLLIDGVLYDSITPGEQFLVDTAELSDGWHDLRVLAFDDTDQRFTGRWVDSISTDNRSRSATLSVTPDNGDWTTAFQTSLDAIGADLVELRLLHNGRVVAAAESAPAQFDIHGLTFGAGPVRIQAEALFADGEKARSQPAFIQVDYSGGAAAGQPPTAFDFTKHVLATEPFVVELPTTYDDSSDTPTWTLLTQPAQSAVVAGSGPYRLMRPAPLTEGTDQFTFQATSAAGASNIATVNIVYIGCIGDLDGDGLVGLADLAILLSNFGATDATLADGDFDGDEDVDLADLAVILARFGNVCD